jgi:hypothetical protein
MDHCGSVKDIALCIDKADHCCKSGAALNYPIQRADILLDELGLEQ